MNTESKNYLQLRYIGGSLNLLLSLTKLKINFSLLTTLALITLSGPGQVKLKVIRNTSRNNRMLQGFKLAHPLRDIPRPFYFYVLTQAISIAVWNSSTAAALKLTWTLISTVPCKRAQSKIPDCKPTNWSSSKRSNRDVSRYQYNRKWNAKACSTNTALLK
jgi:hypothetical protein